MSEGVWKVSGWCLDGLWMVSGWCLDGVWECLDGPRVILNAAKRVLMLKQVINVQLV